MMTTYSTGLIILHTEHYAHYYILQKANIHFVQCK